MKICCLKNSYINTAEEYTISCLLNRCGFFFEWVSDAAAKKEEALLDSLKKIKTDTFLIEKIAREKLGMIKEGDTVIIYDEK